MSLNKDGTYTGYIYKIENLINGKCYIGQTTTTIEHRWGQHKTDNTNPNPMYKAFRKYGIESFSIKEVAHYTRDTKEKLLKILNKKEVYYIDKYSSLITQHGYNLSIGGDNSGIYNCYPVDIYNRTGNLLYQCNSAKEASRLLNGYDVSSILDCCKGITIPNVDYVFRYKDESFDKYSIERKTTGIPVYQFTLKGELINTFDSASQAAKSLGVNSSSITSVLYGINKTCCGYYWNTKNEFNFVPIKDVRRQVDQYDKDGTFIRTFESSADAARKLGLINSVGIIACCKGKILSSHSFIWRYHEDSFDTYRAEPKAVKNYKTLPYKNEPFYNQSKKVDMYSKDKEFLKTFNSMVEAATEINAKKGNISACCLGKAKSVKGYIFRFHGDLIDIYPCEGKTQKQPILVYDLSGNLLNTYPSKNKASKEIGINYHKIEDYCDGRNNHIYGDKIILYEKDKDLINNITKQIT